MKKSTGENQEIFALINKLDFTLFVNMIRMKGTFRPGLFLFNYQILIRA